jgi:hypothetical protein
VPAKEKELFADSEVNENEIIDPDEEMVEHDDLKEGMLAERDPASKMRDPLEEHKGPAVDIVKKSLDGQLTHLGRETAKKLDKMKKFKVLIPFKDLNTGDDFVVVGTNGWNSQIKRGKPVMLPEEIIIRLSNSGESPTLVR